MYFNVLGDGGMHSALYKFNPTTPNVAPILVTEKAGGFAIGSQYLYTADIDWSSTSYETIMQKYSYRMMQSASLHKMKAINSVSA